jgi:GNAT superfamily N-acetyltransferase
MPTVDLYLQTPVVRTPRVLQLEGIFDLPPSRVSHGRWVARLPFEEKAWHIGLIVGPSGSGKSSIARQLWPAQMAYEPAWPEDRAIIDAFPEQRSIKQIVALLCSVGFSSPPAWLRPYRVLSTGQQFRAKLARLLAEASPSQLPPCNLSVNPAGSPIVCDEFSSTVDRTVARLAAHALAKTVRSRGQQLVAITCHSDIVEWLNPDWVYCSATNRFSWRYLRPRPPIALEIRRAGRDLWPAFQNHHYLNRGLGQGVVAWAAFWDRELVAFSAWIHAMTRHGGKREHRTVTLPDYQGAGIGHALSTYVASAWKALGYRATSTTAHPAVIASRVKSADWRMTRPPSLAFHSADHRRFRHARTRLTAGFEYIGPPLDLATAKQFIDDKWASTRKTNHRGTEDTEKNHTEKFHR